MQVVGLRVVRCGGGWMVVARNVVAPQLPLIRNGVAEAN